MKKKIPSICRPYGFADGKNIPVNTRLFGVSADVKVEAIILSDTRTVLMKPRIRYFIALIFLL